MKRYKLGEIADVIMGQSPESKYYNTEGKGLPFLQGNRTFGERYPDFDTYTSVITKKAKAHDVLMSVRAPVGAVNITPIDVCLGRGLCALRMQNGNQDYLYYLMKYYSSQFNKTYGGTIFPSINRDEIKSLIVNIVDDKYLQQRIAKILSTIDAKIELNKKINRELETMAKELYDYWFVQFEFPNEQGKPYKSSGGKMVWNETLKREIPEGWEVKSVNDISVSVRGVGYNKKDEKSFKDDNVVLILRGNNIADNHIVYDDNTVYIDKSFVSPEQVIHKFDLIMTMSSGSKDHVGKSAMFLFDSPHSYGAFCNKITPDIHCEFFLENYLHSEFYKKYIYQTCSGTGINNLTNEHLNHAVFPFPIRKTLHQFNQFVKEWYNNRGLLEQENNQLSEIRNQLLPLLMNGQVRVSEEKVSSVLQKDDTNRFILWKNTYPVAARGEKNDTVLRAMYDAMDDEDK